jgi:shikimate dehydrogenase
MISGKARLAGLIGWPVAHSKSPRLHNHWLQSLGIDGAYVPLPIAPADLAQAVPLLPRLGFVGANVTVPHKESVFDLVDSLDPLAAHIGAVNTLVFTADGRIEGRNTDAAGFILNLQDHPAGFRPRSGPAVILGAGGAARSACAALLAEGVPEIRLVNRSLDRARQLAADLGGPIVPVDWNGREEALEGAALLVNSTSLGMTGQPPLEIALDRLPEAALVNDLVYAPLETGLLAAARARGNPVADGLGMLLHQARPGFAAWFKVMPALTPDIREMMLAP